MEQIENTIKNYYFVIIAKYIRSLNWGWHLITNLVDGRGLVILCLKGIYCIFNII